MQDENRGKVEPLLGLDTAARKDVPPEAASGRDARLQRHLARRNALNAQQGAERHIARNSAAPIARSAHGNELRTTNRPVRRIEQRLTVVSPHAIPGGAPRAEFLLLPSAPAKHDYHAYIGFFSCVLVPIFFASLYFGLYASNQYVTEFRFAVQDTSAGASVSTNGLLALAGAATGAGTGNTNYLVADFLTSREAIDELQKRIKVIDLYAKPKIDWWDRFNPSAPIEKFLPYWQDMVKAAYDPVTGIATATVRAFSPQDAFLIANTMVTLSEELVNRIGNRAATDAVRFAQQEVDRAEQRLKDDRAKMREYRNRVGVIDPTTSVAASNSGLIQAQRANLAQLETQLDTLVRQNLQAGAPAIVALKNQIKSTKEQLAKTEADVGKGINGSALSTVVGEYEQLNLELQFAQAMVTSTMQALDTARANAAAQHLYITPYVRPSLPQSSTYPQPVWAIAKVGFFAFVFWLIGLLIVRSIRERFA